jgi:hypothetical protein
MQVRQLMQHQPEQAAAMMPTAAADYMKQVFRDLSRAVLLFLMSFISCCSSNCTRKSAAASCSKNLNSEKY